MQPAMAEPVTVPPLPIIRPLGDRALIVQFATTLSDAANRAAIDFAHRIEADLPAGVDEVVPNLVSVLLVYDPLRVDVAQLAGEVRLRLAGPPATVSLSATHRIVASFGGDDGPDLGEVAAQLGFSAAEFIARHCASSLRVLATGFAPGFVYCGFHAEALAVPRRIEVRRSVPAGTILFAARQTAITATAIPTGWHVIGRTGFRNFDAAAEPPTRLRAGDSIVFEAAT